MSPRAYRLGRRQTSVDRTRTEIISAARRLVTARPAAELKVGAVARAAGVSRITIYSRFGSRAGLIAALSPPSPAAALAPDGDPQAQLRTRIATTCAHWAADPAMYRNLNPSAPAGEIALDRGLAERLAAVDRLRPGCSIKEAEDVIATLT
jgi:hypothetical protein